MQILSLIWGILAVAGMILGFLPCLGAFNWLNIPFAGIGLIVSIVAYAGAHPGNRGGAVAGIIGCVAAIVIGLFRLAIGGGIF
ncbi:MAG: hypothetical protein ACK5AZ_11685 [Bryobacteraceae bacterium]